MKHPKKGTKSARKKVDGKPVIGFDTNKRLNTVEHERYVQSCMRLHRNIRDEKALQDEYMPNIKRETEVCYEIHVELPEMPPPNEMLNYGVFYEEQVWKRQETLSKTQMAKALRYRGFDDSALNEHEYYEIAEIISREHRRIRDGVWMIIGGMPRYIPGSYYFYLQEWRMKDGRFPTFRESDRKFFLFIEHVIRDPKSKGCIDMENRQQGKSSRFACLFYWATIQCRDTRVGIQSKTEADAKTFFVECIISSWRKLPFWFKPIHDGTDDPKKELVFKSPSEQITKRKLLAGEVSERLPELNSSIDYKPSDVFSYDSQTLLFHFADEYGKTPGVNVVERLQTVQQATIKCFMASTIEDVGKEGQTLEQATILWNQSNPKERNDNGFTVNGLYRYFKPANFCFEKQGVSFINKYGDSLSKEATQFILNARKPLENDQEILMKEIRFNPLSVDEALMPPPGSTSLDIRALLAQETKLKQLNVERKDKWVRGNFEWVMATPHEFKEYSIPGMNTSVEFVPSLSGRFWVVDMLPLNKRNEVQFRVGNSVSHPLYSQPNYEFIPMNDDISVACDPFDYRVSKGVKGTSKGGGAVFLGGDKKDPEKHRFACFYLARPKKSDTFLDDMAKMAFYYGGKVVIETNKSILLEHFINLGMMPFIRNKLNMGTKQTFTAKDVQELGEYTDGLMLDKITVALEKYVSYYCDRILVLEAISQLKRWSPEKSNTLDLALTMGLALLGNEYHTYKDVVNPKYDIDYKGLLRV